jgi:hypothetical protein
MDPQPPSHVSGLAARPNMSTRLPLRIDEPRMDAAILAEAYANAHAEAAREAAPLGPGYRLFWMRPRSWGSLYLPAVRGAFAILGRHTQCDGCLALDPDLSLRHLLVRALPLEDGTVGLRFVDLRATLPFHLVDDTPRRSIFVTGAVAIRLGRYAVVGLPTGGDAPPAELPAPIIEDAPRVPRYTRGPFHTSRISILPPASLIEQIAPVDAHRGDSRQIDVFPPRGAEQCGGRVTLHGAGRVASVELSPAEVDTGVLIGRADKCADGGLRAVLNEGISRAHLLIVREGDDVVAYDTCSTQGTYSFGRRVRCARLPDEGAELTLGINSPVRLTWEKKG